MTDDALSEWTFDSRQVVPLGRRLRLLCAYAREGWRTHEARLIQEIINEHAGITATVKEPNIEPDE